MAGSTPAGRANSFGRPVLIIGANGSMGKRYQAILSYLSVPFECADVEPVPSIMGKIERSSSIILATPTPTHRFYLQDVLLYTDHPVLCEKPIVTELALLEKILDRRAPLQMMAQYKYLDPVTPRFERTPPATVYDYYHSGGDGLGWDCMQLIGLARGPVHLYNTSPVWRCTLNGLNLTLEGVQWAYVKAVEDWLIRPHGDRGEIYRWHEKTVKWIGARA